MSPIPDEAVELAADHQFAAIGERFRQDPGVASLVRDLARAQAAISFRSEHDDVEAMRSEAKVAADRLAAAIPDVAATTPGFGQGWQGAFSERIDT